MTLSRIKFENFKQFEAFTLHLRPTNILVGPNNSGKSTILDGLRLLHACLRYARARTPILMERPGMGVVSGYQMPDSWLPFPIANITRNYSDELAVVEVTHENKSVIRIELNPE